MKVRKYLNQIRKLDIMINQRIREKEQLRQMAFATGGMDYSGDRVQTSPDGTPRQLKLIEKAADMEIEINAMVDKMIDVRHMIIEQIQNLPDHRYVQILFKRYVEYKSFEQIAVDMSYTYKWVCDLHGAALDAFDAAYLKEQEQTGKDL